MNQEDTVAAKRMLTTYAKHEMNEGLTKERVRDESQLLLFHLVDGLIDPCKLELLMST